MSAHPGLSLTNALVQGEKRSLKKFPLNLVLRRRHFQLSLSLAAPLVSRIVCPSPRFFSEPHLLKKKV